MTDLVGDLHEAIERAAKWWPSKAQYQAVKYCDPHTRAAFILHGRLAELLEQLPAGATVAELRVALRTRGEDREARQGKQR